MQLDEHSRKIAALVAYNETENYGDELMNLGLLTTDCTAGEPTSEDEPCTDYESRIYVLTAK